MRRFSPGQRRLARRRERMTSRRGIVTLVILLVLAVGGGVFAWRWQVRQAIEANAPEASLADECADLAELEDEADAAMAERIKACEDAGLLATEGE